MAKPKTTAPQHEYRFSTFEGVDLCHSCPRPHRRPLTEHQQIIASFNSDGLNLSAEDYAALHPKRSDD